MKVNHIMAKKDEIILIIAKGMSKLALTPKELELCCELDQVSLVVDHGLNELQSREVMNWCSLQQRKNIGYTSELDCED